MGSKIEVKYKCPDIHDKESNSFRTACSVCVAAKNNNVEPGVKRVDVERDADGAVKCPTFKCPHTDNELSVVGSKEVSSGIQIMTKMTKSQVVADRSARSKQHFREEILPTMPKEDQLHYLKK